MRKIFDVIKKRLIVLLCISILLVDFKVAEVNACSYHQGWDLVDGSRDVDWGGTTKYMAAWKHAVNEWNAVGEVDIQEDTIFSIEDVVISDVVVNGVTWIGMTYSSGKIEFNTTFMDEYSVAERKSVATHELGHALGIDHINKSDAVMYKYMNSRYILTDLDMSVYYCLWGGK